MKSEKEWEEEGGDRGSRGKEKWKKEEREEGGCENLSHSRNILYNLNGTL